MTHLLSQALNRRVIDLLLRPGGYPHFVEFGVVKGHDRVDFAPFWHARVNTETTIDLGGRNVGMDDADAVGGTEMAGVAGGRSRVRGQAGQEVGMPDRRSQSDRVT